MRRTIWKPWSRTRPDQTAGGETALKGFLDYTEPNAETVRRSREASPITYVKKGMPPFLLIHGTSDRHVRQDDAGGLALRSRVEGGAHGMSSWDKNPAMQGYKV